MTDRSCHGSHLRLLVRPSGNNHPNGQENDRNDLQSSKPLPPYVAGCQCGNASTGSEDNMYRNRDIVAECMVVQHVDGEEEEDIDQPPADGDAVRSKEEGWAVGVELGKVAGGSNEDELYKGQEGPLKTLEQ